MSEHEIQRRQEYKRNRKKWMLIQIVIIASLAVIALGSFVIYNALNRTYYIEYSEQTLADYSVHYMENDFFEEEWLGKDQAYISSLTDIVKAEFGYRLDMDASNVSFDYEYEVNAKMIITDKTTGKVYYTEEEAIIEPKSDSIKRSYMRIYESVEIDYAKFNEKASSFTDVYDLKDATSMLVVTFDVKVESAAKNIRQDKNISYSTAINIPLDTDTFSIHTSAGAPERENKIVAHNSSVGRNILFISGIVHIILSVLGVVGLLIFLHLTKNEDITYTAKINKILRAYGAYITRMDGEFDDEGYQIIPVKTFTEMLGVRDTIQRPVLMSENKDKTMTRFLIPTDTQVLYVFEIRVDNYDDIYAPKEEPVVLEDIDNQALVEAMSQPDVDLENIDFDPDDDDDFAVAEDQPGVEVIGVVWPERAKHNKVYRYDPNGEVLNEGDIVLVPTRDAKKGEDVLRKVAVAHANHRVDPEHIKHPLKKIVAIIKRHTVHALTPEANKSEEK